LLSLLAACRTPATPQVSPAPSDKLGEIQGRGRLIIATDPSYPPQSELIQGAERPQETRCASTEYTASEIRGFDIDVAVEFARRLGVEPCFVTPVWSQIVAGNWADQWDISIGSMGITRERMEVMYFSQPYLGGTAVAFVHSDNKTITKLDDLSGKRIGVCAGCAYEDYLKATLVIPGKLVVYRIQNATVIGYDTDTSAFDDLAKGDGVILDAVMSDPDTGAVAIKKGYPMRQIDDPAYYEYVAAAIDKKSMRDPLPFLQKATEIIQQMHKDGTLRKLSLQYFGSDYAKIAEVFNMNSLDQHP
jgi:polar amino acid transport system substrate-binding protein